MNMWTAIFLISVAGIVAGIIRDIGKRRRNDATTDELQVIQTKIDALENELRERVETLERILTNPKEDLKRQFEHLDKAS